MLDQADNMTPRGGRRVFRFLALPPEIRNSVYKLLLGEPIDVSCQTGRLGDLERYQRRWPQILRTCSFIYQEARSIMFMGNVFIEVQLCLDRGVLLHILDLLRWSDIWGRGRPTAYSPIVHKIYDDHTKGIPTNVWVPLNKINLWCQILQDCSDFGWLGLKRHQLYIRRSLIVGRSQIELLHLSLRVREAVLESYRKIFGLGFNYYDELPKSSDKTLYVISAPSFLQEADGLFQYLESQKIEADQAYQRHEYARAVHLYRYVELYGVQFMREDAGREHCESGGRQYMEQLLKLCYEIFLRLGHCFSEIASIPRLSKQWPSVEAIVDAFRHTRSYFHHSLIDIMEVAGFDWSPSKKYVILVAYRYACTVGELLQYGKLPETIEDMLKERARSAIYSAQELGASDMLNRKMIEIDAWR